MLLVKLKTKYSSTSIGNIRKLYNLKICFRKHLNFLKYKDNFVKTLSNRIVKKNKYIKSYKTLSYFYILYLRSNLSNNKLSKNFLLKFKNKDIYTFLYAYKQYLGMNDFNRALLWKLLQINSIFKIRTTVTKHKKKLYYSNRITFIKPKLRILTSWTWLKFFIKSFDKKNINIPLENFLTSKKENDVLTKIKYQVYKIQLLRSL